MLSGQSLLIRKNNINDKSTLIFPLNENDVADEWMNNDGWIMIRYIIQTSRCVCMETKLK